MAKFHKCMRQIMAINFDIDMIDGPFARPFARFFVPLTDLLAPQAYGSLRFTCSLTRVLAPEIMRKRSLSERKSSISYKK